MRARIVCGGANNQLATAGDEAQLASRNITFISDYLAGTGGIIDFHQESIDDSPASVKGLSRSLGRVRSISCGVHKIPDIRQLR
jgi:leucine dehydrogenase